MSSTPLLSVGLFVYNGERFLEEALCSIVNQTFTDFELIISDNASTDQTGEIANAYAKHDNRIRYHRSEKNMGAGWNARRVYELATGKYFKWAAVDDLLQPDLLRRCVEVLESNPDCVLAYASTKEVDENQIFLQNYVTPTKTDLDDPVARFREMLLTDHNCYQIFGVIRMSALRQLPPQGTYVNGDRVLIGATVIAGPILRSARPSFHQQTSLRAICYNAPGSSHNTAVPPDRPVWHASVCRVVGSGKNSHCIVSGVSRAARVSLLDLSRPAYRWTETALLHVAVAVDRHTSEVYIKRITYRSRSNFV